MICLADNDFVIKLAALDFLAEGFAVVGVSHADVEVLPSAASFLRRRKQSLESQWTAAGFDRAYRFVLARPTLSVAGDPAEISALQGVERIDGGEANLFASAIKRSDFVVATGDRSSLRALAGASGLCPNTYHGLSNHVICFEQVLSRLIKSVGFDVVLGRAYPFVRGDRALERILREGPSTLEISAVGRLRELLSHESLACGDLLVPT